MHFEVLVEDQSGEKALDIIIPKIIGEGHTYKIHAYRGIGRIPRNLQGVSDPKKRILLMELPRLLRGYGKAYSSSGYQASVIVVCDLDDRCLKNFRNELLAVLNQCPQKPETRFCIAVEEGEAWFLGDIPAIKIAYPHARGAVLNGYINDSICGTWEVLANAIYRGGAQALSQGGWQKVGAEKSAWAENISPHMNIDTNQSPSFCYFREKLRELAD